MLISIIIAISGINIGLAISDMFYKKQVAEMFEIIKKLQGGK